MRKARTRTLIQAGGLIEKSGLFETLGIQLGDDLQKNPDLYDSNAALLGGLMELNQQLKEPYSHQQMMIWAEIGKACLKSGKVGK